MASVETQDVAFEESRFQPSSQHCEQYKKCVQHGYERMGRRRVVIAGLARDLEWILPWTMARVARFAALFGDYRVVVYENDSSDHTLKLLHAWSQSNRRVHVLSEQRLDPVNQPTRCLSRAARMAYYRSQCQEYIVGNLSDYEEVILLDMDLDGGWSHDGVAHTYGCSDWDFVGANGVIYRRSGLSPNRLVHYDAWAYRDDPEFTPLTTKQVNRILFHRGQPLQTVYSCFGGLGIYTMQAYQAGRYSGADVEHVTFHRELHQRGFGRTFLNPNQIALYGRKHRSWDRFAAKMIRIRDRSLGRSPEVWQFAERMSEQVSRDSEDLKPRRAA